MLSSVSYNVAQQSFLFCKKWLFKCCLRFWCWMAQQGLSCSIVWQNSRVRWLVLGLLRLLDLQCVSLCYAAWYIRERRTEFGENWFSPLKATDQVLVNERNNALKVSTKSMLFSEKQIFDHLLPSPSLEMLLLFVKPMSNLTNNNVRRCFIDNDGVHADGSQQGISNSVAAHICCSSTWADLLVKRQSSK